MNSKYAVAATAGLVAAAAAGVIAGMAGHANGTQDGQAGAKTTPVLYEELRTRTPYAQNVTLNTGNTRLDQVAQVDAGSKLRLDQLQAGTNANITGPEGALTLTQADSNTMRSDRLAPGRTYTVQVTAVDGSAATWTVSTSKAKNPYTASVNLDGSTWGVAAPLTVTFTTPVKNKAEVTEALQVAAVAKNASAATPNLGDVAWVWKDDQTVTGRAEQFWPGHARITVTADLDGVQASTNKWGTDLDATFTTGTDRRIYTNFDTYKMVVKEDGEKVATYPISGGKPGWETREGIKPISEKYEIKRLYNPGPNGWDVTVPWGMRLTYSGEFIHSAPWNGAIGYANTSHGCTNLTTAQAGELFANTLVGDPVISTGGNGGPVQEWDTWGGAWAYTWQQWQDKATQSLA